MDEVAFRAAVAEATTLYEQVIGHAASRIREMIARYGEIEACSRLVVSPDLQQGFRVLRDRNMLDQTCEALVVRFRHLFDEQTVLAAQWRLDNAHNLL